MKKTIKKPQVLRAIKELREFLAYGEKTIKQKELGDMLIDATVLLDRAKKLFAENRDLITSSGELAEIINNAFRRNEKEIRYIKSGYTHLLELRGGLKSELRGGLKSRGRKPEFILKSSILEIRKGIYDIFEKALSKILLKTIEAIIFLPNIIIMLGLEKWAESRELKTQIKTIMRAKKGFDAIITEKSERLHEDTESYIR